MLQQILTALRMLTQVAFVERFAAAVAIPIGTSVVRVSGVAIPAVTRLTAPARIARALTIDRSRRGVVGTLSVAPTVLTSVSPDSGIAIASLVCKQEKGTVQTLSDVIIVHTSYFLERKNLCSRMSRSCDHIVLHSILACSDTSQWA